MDESNVNIDDLGIDIRVDPTVELFCTIHRLAETSQYTVNELPIYISDINDHFGSFRDHPTINLATELRGTHRINGSSPMALALYLEAPPLLNVRNILNPPPLDLDPRWTPDIIPEFIKAARLFAEDTKFMDFYNSHQEFYDRTVRSMLRILENENILPWFEDYFSYTPEKYTIIIGMQNGFGNYGMSITNRDSTKKYISIIGASSPSWWSGVPKFSFDWFIPTVVHEFCHSYVNPLVKKHDDLFKEPGEVMYPSHAEKLMPKGYTSYEIMFDEYLVRASTIRYLMQNRNSDFINRRIKIDEGKGFVKIRGLIDLLEKYETNRDQYSTLEDFIPEVAVYFETVADSIE